MSFDWTRGRRLSSITAPGSMFSYSYNDSGIRTSKTVNATTTNYTLSGSKIYRQTDGTNTLEFYYDESGQLLGFTTAGVKYWYVRNLQGDIIGIIDNSGNQVVSYSYDAWGRPLSTTGSLASTIGVLNPFRYRGYYFDSETGFYYLNSRYYDPEVGRFLNADSADAVVEDISRSMLAANLYVYCWNNSVISLDIEGQSPVLVGAIAGGGSYLSAFSSITAANLWNPAGWFLLGVATAAAVFGLAYLGYKYVQAQNAAMLAKIRDALGGIASQYGNYKCKEAARAMQRTLNKLNADFKIWVLKFSEGGHILSKSKPGESISVNGFHVGVCVEHIVYCNVHPYGLPEQAWIDDFEGRGKKEVIIYGSNINITRLKY
jgi:RHS repeat-associated protein